MNRRFMLFAAIVAAVLVALTVSNIRYSPWTRSTARTVEQRGPLSDAERANIRLHRLVGRAVAVDVGDDGDPHATPLPG